MTTSSGKIKQATQLSTAPSPQTDYQLLGSRCPRRARSIDAALELSSSGAAPFKLRLSLSAPFPCSPLSAIPPSRGDGPSSFPPFSPSEGSAFSDGSGAVSGRAPALVSSCQGVEHRWGCQMGMWDGPLPTIHLSEFCERCRPLARHRDSNFTLDL